MAAPTDDDALRHDPTLPGDDDAGPLPSEVPPQLGRYRIIRRLDRGGQGAVYLADDTVIRHRRVALKVLRAGAGEDGRARFRREAEIAAKIGGDGIIEVLDGGTDQGLHWIALKFIEGRTLANIIEEGATLASRGSTHPTGPIDPLATRGDGPITLPDGATAAQRSIRVRRVIELMESIARIVARFHAAGVIHRDLKPGNLMIRPDGSPVILDFGLASEPENDETLTQTGEGFGTPAYMAPERIAGGLAKSGTSGDVWALGVILHECLTGQRPFAGGSRQAVFESIRQDRPRPEIAREPGIPKDLAVVAEIALQKNPGDRFPSAAALADDLRAILEHRPPQARPLPPHIRAVRWVQRNRTLAAAIAISFTALSTGLVVALLQARRAERSLQDWLQLADYDQALELSAQALERPMDRQRLVEIEARYAEIAERIPEHRSALERSRGRGRLIRVPNSQWRNLRRSLEFVILHDIPDHYEFAWFYENQSPPANYRPQHAERVQREVAKLTERIAFAHELADKLHRTPKTIETYVYDSTADQLQANKLEELVRVLDATVTVEAGAFPTRKDITQRIQQLTELAAAFDGERRAAFQAAAARVAAAPIYRGLQLHDRMDLAPLGQDLISGFEEFALLTSGEAPARGADGRLLITESSAVVLVLLPGGRTTIGARPRIHGQPHQPYADELAGARRSSIKQRRIDLPPFFISKFEVTKAQWLRVHPEQRSLQVPRAQFRSDPDRNTWSSIDSSDLQLPVESIERRRALQWCRWLGLDLPIEAEWEYAARGGTDTTRPFGNDPMGFPAYANLADLSEERFRRPGRAGQTDNSQRAENDGGDDLYGGPRQVGGYEANGFGLHDMIGNVSEWTTIDAMTYAWTGISRAGLAVEVGQSPAEEIHRGGNFATSPVDAAVVERSFIQAGAASALVGFRPVLRLTPRTTE